MAYAAAALQENDMERLFRVLDERSRHAMFSIVADRTEAARLIRADYPEDEQAAALAALGDGAQVETPAAYFALRCDAACLEDFRANIAAPVEETPGEVLDEEAHPQAEALDVTTARGAVSLYRSGTDHWWGLAWQRSALDAERNRASRDLRQIEQNAATYRRRTVLSGEPTEATAQ